MSASRPTSRLRLSRWNEWPVVAVALVSAAAGFGQFGAVSALGDVARAFGHSGHGASIAEQAGLSGTELGLGLAILRLSSLGGLPLSSLADRWGRRRVLLWTCALGLALTVAAAVSPGYWWFVVIFALGRPLLSATTGVAQVAVSEQTATVERAKALALVTAGYGVGAGITAIINSLGRGALGFRGLFALAVLPLLAIPLLGRRVVEPDRFAGAGLADDADGEGGGSVSPTPGGAPAGPAASRPALVLGPAGRPFRRRLIVICVLFFALSVVTGPADSFLFIYAQNVEHVAGVAVSAMVVGAGLAGLIGLLVGRWAADHVGRRPTAAVSMAALCLLGVLAYSGSHVSLYVGYIAGILVASIFAPAAGAIVNELFPTEIRGAAIGWEIAAGVVGAVVGLLAFGAIADVGDRFSVAAAATFLPMIPAVGLLWLVPETRGRELEELWP